MKKPAVLAAFLLAALTMDQAKACDMGAIESWVAAACKGNACATKRSPQQPAQACDGSNCTRLPAAAPKVGCAGSDCAG